MFLSRLLATEGQDRSGSSGYASIGGGARSAALSHPSRRMEIDTLRGIACVMLVAYHVVGYSAETGLRLESGLLRDVNELLIYFRMPLFTVLSGYVYALRPYRAGGALKFVQGKARRLLLPLLFVGTFFAVTQSLVPGTNSAVSNWWLLHIVPYAHFWFLESLFLIFLLILLLESFQLISTVRRVAVVFALASLAYVSKFGTVYFSVFGAVYLFPYFLLGLALCRFGVHERVHKWYGWGLFAALVALVATLDAAEVSKFSPVALFIGCASCAALLFTRLGLPGISDIGRFSYAIFLFHVFFTAGCRIFLYQLGVENIAAHFFVAMLLGLGGPILLELVLRRYRLTRLLLLGQK